MSRMHEPDIAIVGAGPAGLSAALAARSHGASVLLIDENAAPGGQYYRQPFFEARGSGGDNHEAGGDSGRGTAQARRGRQLTEEAERAGVEIWRGATVWAGYPDGVLSVARETRSDDVRARRVIVATGAHDRVMPFPGWTLPGVMTAGAAQTLRKAHDAAPGRRIVVAGSGPFLLVVALDLARAGARVELIEAAPPDAGALGSMLKFPSRWRELAGLVAGLIAHGVRIRTGRAVTRAEGSHAVTAVISHRLGRDGAPIAGTGLRHDADAVAVAFGFRTQPELARLLGCATRYDEARGGHAVVVDPETGRTSIEAIYAAGEVTGVAGHEVAAAEGTIAGSSAAASLGFAGEHPSAPLAQARARRRRAQSFADLVAGTFAPRAGITALATPDTVVCRCEGVTRAEIHAAVDAGARTTSAVKRWTRCGMGPCQARMCGWPLARIVAERLHCPAEVADNLTARIPLKPVPLGLLDEPDGATAA
jgi:NADPH-dependent 2,4-dienoyl-CoA reductase/sulfur reductase-like enzyme